MENREKPGPLDGIRVLDLGHYIAIPILTRMMADLGAEMIKVEAAPHGDLTRFTAESSKMVTAAVLSSTIAASRASVSTLKTPEGAAIVRDLARSVDVITENYSPGVLPRYGLGYEDFRKINQRVIMLSISGFGQDGPLKHRVGNDTVALAMSGLMHLTGDPDGPPVYVGLFIADENAGVHGLAAVCAALYHREKTGIGQYIDLSLLECMFHLHDTAIAVLRDERGEVESESLRLTPLSARAMRYLQGQRRLCRDHRARSSMGDVWRRRSGGLEWLSDPRFATREARVD